MKPFKRVDSTDAPYYVKFSCKNKQYLWSTKTNDLVLARKRAKAFRDAVYAESFHLVESMKQRSATPTFAAIIETYNSLPLIASKQTRTRNIASMVAVLGASGYDRQSRVDVLGAKIAIVWQQKRDALKLNEVSCNSKLRFARSLFSEGAMIGYRAMGLAINDQWVRDFASVRYIPEPEVMPDPPSDEQMAAAEERLPTFPAEWRAYLLAKYGCCRSGEIKAARRDWIKDSVLYIGGKDFIAKSRKWRAVALPPEVALILLSGDDDYIVGSNREKIVDRNLPTMLKALGFTSAKPLMSLNKWHVSWRATNQGIAQAQQARGHASPVTTMRHYGRVLDLAEPVAWSGKAS